MKSFKEHLIEEKMSPVESARKYSQNIDVTFADVIKEADRVAKALVKKYAYARTDMKEVPSAPNTGSFIARKYGMIDYVRAQYIQDGFFNREYRSFVQIGSNVDRAVKKKIQDEYITALKKKFKLADKPSNIMTTDNYRFYLDTAEGSAWSPVGIVILDSFL